MNTADSLMTTEGLTPLAGKKLRGLFLNTPKANCSIHESGMMAYRCLVLSDTYQLDYREIDSSSRKIPRDYHFYIFNHHYATMSWLDTECVRQLPGLKATLVLEMLPNQPFVLCPPNDFDVYLVLDPTMNIEDKRVYAMPRPLEVVSLRPGPDSQIPVIGTFGFATAGKGFELVVDAVNKEFDEAIVRINIPQGTHTSNVTWHLQNRDYREYLIELCRKVAKKGVQVIVTDEYMTKEALIEWCSRNTLNCFFYNRDQPGLAATTDQAISSGRPLSVSTNETFRHIHRYIEPYPFQTLKESIASSRAGVLDMQRDWSPRRFAEKLETALTDFDLLGDGKIASALQNSNGSRPETFELHSLEKNPERSLANDLRELNIRVRSKLKIRTRIKQLLRIASEPIDPRPSYLEDLKTSHFQSDTHVGTYEPQQRQQAAVDSSASKTILIVSHREERCGIHQYGMDIAEALKKSARYRFAYAECSTEDEFVKAVADIGPAAIIYNYYPATMPWLTSRITRRYQLPQLGLMHEVTQDAADNATPELFDYHLCPDPTLRETNPHVVKIPRLIPPYVNYKVSPAEVTIGSFGFGFVDKGFQRLIETVQQEFDHATIVLNLPSNDIVGEEFQQRDFGKIMQLKHTIFKPGIRLRITQNFFTKDQLLDFLAANTLNAFFYDTNKHLGISSTIDYALAVQRPIAITKCGMFRHITSATPSICIEDSSLNQIIENGIVPLVRFYNEWSESNFILHCEQILDRVLSKERREYCVQSATGCGLSTVDRLDSAY
jgi:hypothetical protein